MNRHYFYRWFILVTGFACSRFVSNAQDLHFADFQSMGVWYNQSLKMDNAIDFRLNYRDVKYQSLVAFRTASALVNIPIYKKEGPTKSFLNFTTGGNFDQSNAGIFKNNTFLLGISYAQQLSDNQTYLSAGFQGTSTRSIFGSSNVTFPDQFDPYGPIPASTRDPLNAGRTYNWNSLHAGISIFQNTENKEWYIGGSLRHINRPYTDESKTEAYRLSASVGIQAGITVKNEYDQFGVYGLAYWQSNAYEYLLGTKFNRVLTKADGNHEGTAIGAGIALRVHDAIIPNVQLKFNKTVLGIHYDMNISGLKAAGYSRQAFELAISQRLN
jgi:type IX secretion system PorP/SprF family membrane protein